MYLALADSSITHVGLSGFSPSGRIQQYIRQARKDAEMGRISWEEAEERMNFQYESFKKYHSSDTTANRSLFISWKSFSKDRRADLLKIDQPIYVVFGTSDIVSDDCDYLPLDFIAAGKKNLTIKRYFNMEHNYFELDENGDRDYDKFNWPKMMDGFWSWVEAKSDEKVN
ncbi:hypothetical protein [Aureibacter tunicatorum]|uniref:Pimeloyl-ACP methyl ester carboxylesterase n=1 Tax=Aureibacter tunicatorum TaxID=866807 RepID=A0AAE4BUD2_9BACT|nr:hypothetical protein [Aureibacter tunicatorum]MDR6240940.1 pimeloyl-ACP methyl ester carboxylesterase [Aureibacter tunicatorum]BDD03720.1 hypothetical protein AUTU_12030 [Aureibacter tunicatorum]